MIGGSSNPTRTVLSEKEIKNFKGKRNSLDTLADKPRAFHPDIIAKINKLYGLLDDLITLGKRSYSTRQRALFEFDMQIVRILEDIIIRFCHSNKTIAEIEEDIARANAS